MSTKAQLFLVDHMTAELQPTAELKPTVDPAVMAEFDALPFKARLGRVVADVSTLVFSALGTGGSAADIVPVGGKFQAVWVEATDDGQNVAIKAVYSTDASVPPYTALLKCDEDFSVQVNNFARMLIVGG